MDSARPAVLRCLSLFPISVLLTEIIDPVALNTELIRWVQQLQQQNPGVQRTNAGGWHSNKDLANSEAPAIHSFLQLAREALTEWATQSFTLSTRPDPTLWQVELWANLNRRGHYNHAHDHFRTGTIASAFYYVQCGGENVGGRTVFLNQQSVPSFIELGMEWRDRECALTPKDGTLAVFPSWLGHRVEPFLGDGDRITLALNAGHPQLPVKRRGDRPLSPWLKRLLGR